MQNALEELTPPGILESCHMSDSFQQLSEQDIKALDVLFEAFNMKEVELDLLRLSDTEGTPEPEWFSLVI